MTTPYERVKLSRARTAKNFPLPSPLDCIRYAITELAEYDDAMLRAERTADKRNNDRTPDARAELGQAMYMLLSAAVQWRTAPKPYGTSQYSRLHLYSSSLSWLIGFTVSPTSSRFTAPLSEDGRIATGLTVSGAYAALCDLAACHGWEVGALVDETCATFERKHAEVML